MSETVERHEFGAEVGRLLDLVVHALYSEREIFLRELVANAADAVALDAVKGIGPATSAAIIQARKAGPFKSWADLVTRVRGVGEANAARLSAAGLTVNGQPYIRVQPVAATATATATAAALPASATGAGRPR